ncbi:hypothetical protein D9611_006142 [Ephemerocybe angulata]|uniref:Endonuclease/exonuclease/phosphatase domain-containing protein n=1 Tax=Ephemerocybe angulata TaxID=980116 RepID=A0A8H5CGK8_9AGAR|nr:hypothetical protein D9611_006142 [Tulosesus angulatus]
MARGGKRSRPPSAPDDNPRPPRRMSLTPDPDHMDEDFPAPPQSPSASSSEAPNSNSSASTVNQTDMAQQLPFNPSPSPDPGQQGGAPGGPQHGVSGSGAAGPTINVIPPGGQHPGLAPNPASGSGGGPLPPPPPPPPAQHQIQHPPVLPAHQPGTQTPFHLNPVPGGGFPAILYRIEHITESMSDPQRQELRNAGVRSAIAFLSEDNPGNDPETRRMVLRAVLDGIGLASVVPRPFGLVPGRTHRRGHAHRRPAAMYLLEDLSPQQELMILQRPAFSTNRGTIFIFSLPLMHHSIIGILGGVVAEVRDASTNFITTRVADQLIDDEETLAFIRDHRDRFHAHMTLDECAQAIRQSVRVIGQPNPGTGLGQWYLRVETPTNDHDLTLQWVDLIRKRSFDTGFGIGSALQPTQVISALSLTSPAGVLRCLCVAPMPLALAVVEAAVLVAVLTETALVGAVDPAGAVILVGYSSPRFFESGIPHHLMITTHHNEEDINQTIVPQANGSANPSRRGDASRVSSVSDDDTGGLRDLGTGSNGSYNGSDSNSNRDPETGNADGARQCRLRPATTPPTANTSQGDAAPTRGSSASDGPRTTTKGKKSRAALRVASLNMNGGNLTSSFHKWSQIQSIVRTSSLSVLALQETHITEQDRVVIENHFRKLKLFVNPDRDSASNRNGVAFVINIDKVRWDEASHTVIEPGRASLLELPWHNAQTVNILTVYAPSGDDRENENFWRTLSSRWNGRNSPPKVHIMLGDFNFTEATNDRLPLKRPPRGPVEALDSFKVKHSLLDGWRQLYGPDGSNYTFSCRNRDGSTSWSRIDRIYCEKPLLDQSCEWLTTFTGTLSDHYLVSAVFEPENTPFVGKGRSTAPAFITEFPDAQRLLVKRTIQLDLEIKTIPDLDLADPPAEARSQVQMKWLRYKKDILELTTRFARDRTSRIDEVLSTWERRRTEVLREINGHDHDNEELMTSLSEIDDNIRALSQEKFDRRWLVGASRHHVEGETGSKYDFYINRARKPRDTVPSLRIPDSAPPQYEHNSKKMVEIASKYHDGLQDKFHIQAPAEDQREAEAEVLAHIKTKLSDEQRSTFDRKLTKDEVHAALMEVPNGKASGLDGIPVEFWKFLVKEQERLAKKSSARRPPYDLLDVLTRVFNEIEEYGVAPGSHFTEGWMCPIHKKNDRTDVANYRPITVLNTDYKILTRALSNKLGQVATSLIHEDQAGFLCNRSITDHTALLHSVMALSEMDGDNGVICILDRWCLASGAKFNINKTVIIPRGSQEYCDWVRRHRRLNNDGTLLPENVRIPEKGEPTRILGAYYGEDVAQEELWKPILEKIRLTLARWDKSKPTIRGRAQAVNAMVGGYTQYFTKVQGMPEKVLKQIESMIDDFVYAKKGEKKANAIGIENLQRPYMDGGLNLLDE